MKTLYDDPTLRNLEGCPFHGGENFDGDKDEQTKSLYYADYLALGKILQSQHPRSFDTNPAYDEMLFIIVHQAYELWFKQILFELDLVIQVFEHAQINDNSADMNVTVHRLRRIAKIWQLLIDQVEILETMTPLDFLEFREMLKPASGFQSVQFRLIEARFGLQMNQRSNAVYYKHTGKGGFSEDDYSEIETTERGATLKPLLMRWLERMPFFENDYWNDYEQRFPSTNKPPSKFWSDYKQIFYQTLGGGDDKQKLEFDRVFETQGSGDLSPQAMKAVLFIMLYRDLPIFRLPFELLNTLIEIDELIATWRYRHLLMVRRMIGLRVGTGGTSGTAYLEGTLAKHYIYKELTEITTFFIPRRKLPVLATSLREKLSFNL